MDRIVETGRANNWSKDQYREALDDLVATERKLLKSGDRALNKNAREWANGRMGEWADGRMGGWRRAEMTIYVWGMPAEYPSAYIGDYRLPGNPDRFQFLKGESVPTIAVVPTIRFNAPLKLLQRYACLPSNAMAPIVSAELRRFLEASAAACLQFFPVSIATTTGASDDYSLLNAIQKVEVAPPFDTAG